MKKTRLFLSALVVLAVVGSAFAFRPLGQGKVYCSRTTDDPQTGICENKISWQEDPAGTVVDPCNNGPLKEYFIDGAGKCQQFNATTFSTTPL